MMCMSITKSRSRARREDAFVLHLVAWALFSLLLVARCAHTVRVRIFSRASFSLSTVFVDARHANSCLQPAADVIDAFTASRAPMIFAECRADFLARLLLIARTAHSCRFVPPALVVEAFLAFWTPVPFAELRADSVLRVILGATSTTSVCEPRVDFCHSFATAPTPVLFAERRADFFLVVFVITRLTQTGRARLVGLGTAGFALAGGRELKYFALHAHAQICVHVSSNATQTNAIARRKKGTGCERFVDLK